MPRHDYRSQSPLKYGKPTVTYPYGDTRFPRIVEQRTARKGPTGLLLLDFLTPHFDQASFPNAFLTEQTADQGDDTDKNITETYETLPGPIQVEVNVSQDTGIPMLVARQRRAVTDIFDEGELIIPPFNILTVQPGPTTIVTLDVSSQTPKSCLLSPRQWVTISGTGTSLDGNQRILAVLAEDKISFDLTANQSSTSGTCQPINHVMREIKQSENVCVIIKIDGMVAAEDVTVYNESDDPGARGSILCWHDFSFPDSLVKIVTLADIGTASETGTVWAFSTTTGTAFGCEIQHGYRGPCQANRFRFFSMGAGPGSYLDNIVATQSITIITPSSGTIAAESLTNSQQESSGGSSESNSFTWRMGSIPPVLTAGLSGTIGAFSTTGFGVRVVANLPPSTPLTFNAGDAILLVEQPQKLQNGLWQVIVYSLRCPYTMTGGTTGSLSYTQNIVSYVHGTAITANNATYTGPGTPSTFSISPALPTGLSIDATTGAITGTPSAVTIQKNYTVTASDGGASAIDILTITVT